MRYILLMSNITTERKPIEEIDEKRSIVNYFYAYCNHNFGSQRWEEYMQVDEFRKMMEEYLPIFGDSVFSVLVDNVAIIEKITIMELLSNFSNFVRKYY